MNERMNEWVVTKDKGPSPMGVTQMNQKGTLPSRILRSTGKHIATTCYWFWRRMRWHPNDTQLWEFKAGLEQEVVFKLKSKRWFTLVFSVSFNVLFVLLCLANLTLDCLTNPPFKACGHCTWFWMFLFCESGLDAFGHLQVSAPTGKNAHLCMKHSDTYFNNKLVCLTERKFSMYLLS